MENGDVPGDISFIGGLVRDICFCNAQEFFGFNSLAQTTILKEQNEFANPI
jgi:hypothetical protein